MGVVYKTTPTRSATVVGVTKSYGCYLKLWVYVRLKQLHECNASKSMELWHALVYSWAYSYGAMGSRNAKTQIRYECTGDRSHLECPTS